MAWRPECRSPEMWELAYSDVMLRQQSAVAKLLGKIEEENAKAAQMHAQFEQYDAGGNMARLRAEVVGRRMLLFCVEDEVWWH